MDDQALLGLAADLARQAGATILTIRARGFDTVRKADASPVTEADRAAEALILAGLRRATPDIPTVAEEAMAAGDVPPPADTFWLVDPLDGTREFAAGRDDFAVCIGLIENGVPVLGVVTGPAHGQAYGAIKGKGAIKRDASGERPIHVRACPQAGLSVIASRSFGKHPRMAEYLAERHVAEILNTGSALKFCRIAEGVADLYPRFGRTMEWDTAAAQIILEEAGGSVRNIETGEILHYGKPGFDNPHFVASAT